MPLEVNCGGGLKFRVGDRGRLPHDLYGWAAESGDVLVRISKRRNVAPHCPLILYSTRDTVELAQLAKECGADGYIHKSGHMFELADQLERYLGKT